MSIALLGLVSFQLYWIKNALNINEARFKQDVHGALEAVTQKLEREEALFVTLSNLNSQFTFSGPTKITSDTIELFESTFQRKFIDRKHTNVDSIHHTSTPFLSFQIKTDDDFSISAKVKTPDAVEGSEIKKEMTFFKKNYPDEKEFREFAEKDFKKVIKKTEMFQESLWVLLSGEKSIHNRVDPERLDSLLHLEFDNKGIDIAFDYGVLSDDSNEFIFSKINDDHLKLRKTELKASLFPNDIVHNSSYLLVNFPDQNSFLIKKIWLTLTSSVILILIIVFCFAYAITTIIRQKKLSEIKNDFINNMTHEFKTPISTVSLACEALQDNDLKQNESIRERYMGIIRDENKRLGMQVEKVLQIATLDKKEFELKLTKVNIHDIIESSLETINLQVQKKGGTTTKSLAAQNAIITADEIHLSNIINNLLDNANKYSPENPDITIKTENNKEGVIIKIIDQGIGIAKDSLNKIFDKFYRVPTGNIHDVKGFGLGLAYVKTMVEAHGGRINVKSELNKGSIFELFFPYPYE
ncbi:HAMP domain-containing sensor histidine kinase [Fulvivirgaceae bacterium BMA10]|uniref:histidine kinase n=2 Tax=Splendidivirga corallicola TaxID=3051826 RepID=A0ABT8KLN1_9BACT|nr:HAMP domain-containing sensor histidine kinase [Fulvivirgaceae bacterium BMA10]